MSKPFKPLSKKYEQQGEKLLSEWIKIDSVYDDKTISEGQPFGQGVKAALRYIGSIAEQDGFNVTYNDGYATEISYGEGPIIGIYAHADVVPISGTWKHPPFGGVIDGKAMYGRGTSDDKGPAMASYMALKLLKDNDLIKGYKVRLVIGGNEERGSGCLHYYFHSLNKPHCVAGFTPDGQFPLIYGEKGIANYEIKGATNLGPIMSIKAGVVSNSVIDYAEAMLVNDPTLESRLKQTGYNYSIDYDGETMKLIIKGKAAHGSLPELGVNAGIQMLDVLGKHYDIDLLKTLAYQYGEPFGRQLGLYFESELLHHTTYNVGLIAYDEGIFSMIVNFRFPENVDFDDVIAKLDAKTPLEVIPLMYSRPLLFDPESPMIKTLLNAYQAESGDVVTPMITIGGGTYAKEAQNTVAFGSNFPGKDDHIHDIDEKIDLEDFRQSIAIYARAIHDLGQLYAPKK